MSRIYKKTNFAGSDSLTGIAFGGGGGGGGGGSYSKKDGVGAAVDYQNTMRSVGYLNTQDYAGQQQDSWKEKGSPIDLKSAACSAGAVTSAAATSSNNSKVKAVGIAIAGATGYLCS